MKRLHESLQERDAAAWDEFYEEHVRELYGFVFRLVRGDPQTAADVFEAAKAFAKDARYLLEKLEEKND